MHQSTSLRDYAAAAKALFVREKQERAFSARDVQRHYKHILDFVLRDRRPVFLTRRGVPSAVLVDIRSWRQMCHLDGAFAPPLRMRNAWNQFRNNY